MDSIVTSDSMIVRLAAALADRYRLDRELGAGGMGPCISRTTSSTTAMSPSRCCIRICAVPSALNASEARSAPQHDCSRPNILPLVDSGGVMPQPRASNRLIVMTNRAPAPARLRSQ